MYATNGIASKFLKEKLAELEEEINSNTISVRPEPHGTFTKIDHVLGHRNMAKNAKEQK